MRLAAQIIVILAAVNACWSSPRRLRVKPDAADSSQLPRTTLDRLSSGRLSDNDELRRRLFFITDHDDDIVAPSLAPEPPRRPPSSEETLAVDSTVEGVDVDAASAPGPARQFPHSAEALAIEDADERAPPAPAPPQPRRPPTDSFQAEYSPQDGERIPVFTPNRRLLPPQNDADGADGDVHPDSFDAFKFTVSRAKQFAKVSNYADDGLGSDRETAVHEKGRSLDTQQVPPLPAPRRRQGREEADVFDVKVHGPRGSGRYAYHFKTSDGIEKQEERDGDNGKVRGMYRYTSPDGLDSRVDYIADEKGFRIRSVNIHEDLDTEYVPEDDKPLS